MNLTLLTYWTDDREPYSQVAAINVPARDAYCARHGYKHVTHCGPYHDQSLYYAVARIFKVYDMLFRDPEPPDYVAVANVQSVITNATIPFESILDDQHDFWIARDCHAINAAVFVVRRCEWSKQWLEMIMREAPTIGHCWHENFVIQTRAPQSPWVERIKLVDQKLMSSYMYHLYPPWNGGTPGNWTKGDFILSLPGLKMPQRLDIIKGIQSSIIT